MRPPSAYLGGVEWGEQDHLLTLAYTVYLDGLNDLGFPSMQARHFDNDGFYEVETILDHSAAALERHNQDNKDPEPGERVFVKYTRPEGKPLGPFTPDAKPNNQGNKSGERN